MVPNVAVVVMLVDCGFVDFGGSGTCAGASDTKPVCVAARPDCSFEGCTDCGACPALGVDVVLAGDHRG